MNKNNLNLNNKFGECCRCPGLVNKDALFNNYVSSRIFENTIQQKFKLNNTHAYRNLLQTKSNYINELNNNYLNNYKCESNNTNKFYIDSSKYNFETKLIKNYIGPQQENNGIKRSEKQTL